MCDGKAGRFSLGARCGFDFQQETARYLAGLLRHVLAGLLVAHNFLQASHLFKHVRQLLVYGRGPSCLVRHLSEK